MESHTQRAVDRSVEAGEQVREQVREKLQEVKPQLRGWLHAATAPLALAAGIVLIVLSPTPATRIGSAIFAASALALFTASATMHRGTWSERVASATITGARVASARACAGTSQGA